MEAGSWKLAAVHIEVIVQSVADARAATDGGADRLEVVRSMRDGGLTPRLAVVEAIKDATSLPLRVMVRENAGFETSDAEIEAMRAAAWSFTKLGVEGLVVGFAKSGELSLAEFTRVIEAAPGVPITFHRAFDSLTDPLGAIDRLSANSRIDGILTSGGEGSSWITRLSGAARSGRIQHTAPIKEKSRPAAPRPASAQNRSPEDRGPTVQ